MSIVLDAVGLIPEAEGVTKVYENMAGYQIARKVGNIAGYTGIVATQQGRAGVSLGKRALNFASGALGLTDTSTLGKISTGATIAGFFGPLGTGAAVVSLGVDAYKVNKQTGACVNSGKYD